MANQWRGYYALSNAESISAGSTAQLVVRLRKNFKRKNRHAHVTKLVLSLRGITVGPFAADSVIDAPLLAQLVPQVSVSAGADSPFGANNGGLLVKTMSMYLALTALSRMSGAAMHVGAGGGQNVFFLNGLNSSNPVPANSPASSALFQEKRIEGKYHTQGPYGSVAAGASWTQDSIEYVLPIGERYCEPERQNPIPLEYLNGGGDACGCSKSEGFVSITMCGASIDGLTVAFSGATAQLFAEIVFLKTKRAPLQPWVSTAQTTQTVMQLQRGISGFRALCEDLTSGGDMQFASVAGVTQYILTADGEQLYDAQYPMCRAGWVNGVGINGTDRQNNGENDPNTTADVYAGANGQLRYKNPWYPIITHLGGTDSAPDFGDGQALEICFELSGAASGTNRRILEGLWLVNNSQYVEKAAAAIGVPATDLQPAGVLLSPASAANGLAAGVALKARSFETT